MYKKIAQVAVSALAALAVIFAGYGLYQSTSVARVLNQQAGYQQCVTDVNAEMAQQAAQQQAQAQAQEQEQPNPETTNEK